MKATPLQALAFAIRNGDYDKKLDYVNEVVFRELKERRSELSYERARRLDLGDYVEVTGNIKPRYLMGVRGHITEIEGTRVTIGLEDTITRTTHTRRRHIGSIIVTAVNLTKVKP